MSKKFNPFYDSEFLISTSESPDEKRYLVELYEDELIQLENGYGLPYYVKSDGSNKLNRLDIELMKNGILPPLRDADDSDNYSGLTLVETTHKKIRKNKNKCKQTKPKINAQIKTDYTTRRCVALIPTFDPHKCTEKWTCMNCNAELSKSDTRCPVCGYKFID